jgi:hypothetical protein
MTRISSFVALIFCLFIVQSAFGQIKSHAPDRVFAVDTLKADLQFVRRKLENVHPALYRYVTKGEMGVFFDSLARIIVRPMNEQEFISLLMLLNAKIRDGHTMFLPSDAATGYNYESAKFLPLSVVYIAGKLYIGENYSGDHKVCDGDEIVSINGQSTADIMIQLLSRQIRDGNNQAYPIWILDHYFAPYYAFTYGNPDQFAFEFRNAAGEVYRRDLPAQSKRLNRLAHSVKYTDTDAGGVEGQATNFEEEKEFKAAVLRIKTFDPGLLASYYRRGYKHSFDSLFSILKSDQIESLILDLRDNQGGDFEPARYLLSC